eukprot:15456092-Alexandrium_andersonii.AAC.1
MRCNLTGEGNRPPWRLGLMRFSPGAGLPEDCGGSERNMCSSGGALCHADYPKSCYTRGRHHASPHDLTTRLAWCHL